MDETSMDPKINDFILVLNVFFSENGIKAAPNKMIIGSFTDNQIKIYVGGKSFALMQLPKVLVQMS